MRVTLSVSRLSFHALLLSSAPPSQSADCAMQKGTDLDVDELL